jgi:hypothetical protein
MSYPSLSVLAWRSFASVPPPSDPVTSSDTIKSSCCSAVGFGPYCPSNAVLRGPSHCISPVAPLVGFSASGLPPMFSFFQE